MNKGYMVLGLLALVALAATIVAVTASEDKPTAAGAAGPKGCGGCADRNPSVGECKGDCRGQCEGDCKGSGKCANCPKGQAAAGATGGCPMGGRGMGLRAMGQAMEGSYIKVNPESQKLWTRMGELVGIYHRQLWELYTLQSAAKPDEKAIEAKRGELEKTEQEMSVVRGGLAQHRVGAPAHAGMGQGKHGMMGGCGGGCGGGKAETADKPG